ncbi:hypothetical protein EES39_32275 [Streptomyces sp. ADI92-24]|nr:hypothetical protein EES39_32275 [Streptomyces sp. ADI92-24]
MLERKVLMGVSGQCGVPDLAQQLGERRIARGVGTEHQGVDEVADQLVLRLVGPTGDRAADRNVVARAELAQQRRQPCLEHHEQTGPVHAGELAKAAVQFGVETGEYGTAPV